MDGPRRTKDFAKKLRREMSPPEVILWQNLRGGRLEGLRFRRQHPMGVYVLDFYCHAAKLAVEVDGAHHTMGDNPSRDLERDAWFAVRGIETLRIPAIDVLTDPSGPLALILATVGERLAGASGHRPARTRE
jgi:very-short-patch-repair endonuclease